MSGVDGAMLPDIGYERFVLDNGLTVIVHEDHKAPVVAVSVWYGVGSAYEPDGKTGFAHLFEHLMFSGSEHHKDVFFKPFELAGATDQNGTTWFDRTNYFQTVPTTALDMALWMESDRMGHLLGAIGQDELDTQRGVVKNEKRQNEDQPYGRAWENIQLNAFPANHPYQHTTIGSMDDLDAASLDDVRAWFSTYYGAANTVLVLAGDITPAQAREKVRTYFGDIPAGPPVSRPAAWIAPRRRSSRGVQRDRVPQVRLMRQWNVPGLGHADAPLLALAAWVLGGDVSSRLYQRLVYRDGLADGVSADVLSLALAGMFMLVVNLRPGADAEAVEAAIAEEWATFLREGPSADELLRARTVLRAELVHGLEKVGGFAGKAVLLAEGQLYRNDPSAYRADLARQQAATPDEVVAAARQWIAQGDYTLTIVPVGDEDIDTDPPVAGLPAAPDRPAPLTAPTCDYATTPSTVDRRRGVPAVTRFPDLAFPMVQRACLSNGMRVILAERHTIPVTQLQLHFDAGLAAEQGRNTGVARTALAMLGEGTQRLDSVEVARQLQRLGATFQPFTTLDSSGVLLGTLNTGLADALVLCAQLVRRPAYRAEDLERLRAQLLATISRELGNPATVASRLLPRLLFGAGHAYGVPFSGTGSLDAVQALTQEDLMAFHATWLRPDRATLFLAGDTTMDTVLPMLESAFGDWSAPQTAAPDKALPGITEALSSRVHLLHRPGEQSQVTVSRLLAPTATPANQAMQLANTVFGGMFTSRLNMNLREDKRWTYGARSGMPDAQGQRPLLVSAPVQVDRTAESIREIISESRAYAGDRPPTEAELDKVKAQSVRALPGSYETTGAVLSTLVSNHLYERPDDYAQTLKQRLEGTGVAQVADAARTMFTPEGMTWVVAGDLAQIEAPVRALELGEVTVWSEEDLQRT
ncbi:pitrilysin family protein [Pseudoxanthomonas sp. PXM04]|uniref:M16 family metallopeptidase n=1 Tax=Pseudoxanthomonas sp. PXM04 TaxID=2769297 RepID=UPI00177B7595|nr:pitrilysin family protein [Pseudoxanthomonas sp. PXM04]MBD9378870.1 insulinase family protein [Pseudoxanthomonas sp. PXM04]